MKRTIARLSGWLTRTRVRLTRWLRKAGPGSHEAAALLAVTAPSAASAPSMAAIPELAERSLVAAPLAERSIAALVDPAPVAASAPTIAAIVADDATAAIPARQFFARMIAAGPEGIVVDFSAWQRVPVERFFLALGSAERQQRRGAAFTEVATIEDAFADFAWD